MSLNKIKQKPEFIPGMIINTYPTKLNLLNSVSLKARYDLRDINIFQKNEEKKKMEYRKKLLSSKLKGRDKNNKEGSESNNTLNMNGKITNNKDYMEPLEEKQKIFFKYYKMLFHQIQKKRGINNYINRIIPNFLNIEKAQRKIQNNITKSKIRIIKKISQKENIDKLPLLQLSSINYNNNSLLENKINKKVLLKLSSFNEDNNSVNNNSKKKLPILKLFSLNDNSDNEEYNKNIYKKKINYKKNLDRNLIYNRRINEDKKLIEKKLNKSIISRNNENTRSCDNIYLFDKNYIPITKTSEFQILSKRGNIQFHNSIFRVKDINEFVNQYSTKEINNILNEITKRRKKYIKNIINK